MFKKIVLLVFFMAMIVSCVSQDNEKEYQIGAILPLTGDLATYGVEIKNGIELGLKECDYCIYVIYEDDKGQPKNGVNAINKLKLQGVKYIIGAVPSSVTLSIAPIAEKNKILLFSPASSSPLITDAGDYIFRNYPSDIYEGKAIADYAMIKGYDSFATITINNDYGIGLKKVFRETVEKAGKKILSEKEYNEGLLDYRTVLASIKNEIKGQHAAIFIVGYGGELGRIIKQAREIGIKNQFFSTVNFLDENTKKAGGRYIEGTIFTSPSFSINSKNKKLRKFVSDYREMYDSDPTIWSGLGYDAVKILSSKIRKYKNVEKVKNALYETKNYEGVTGKTTFDKNGDVEKELSFMRVENGEFTILE